MGGQAPVGDEGGRGGAGGGGAGGPGEPPTKISKGDGGLYSISVFRGDCYLTTNKNYKQKCLIKTGKF